MFPFPSMFPFPDQAGGSADGLSQGSNVNPSKGPDPAAPAACGLPGLQGGDPSLAQAMVAAASKLKQGQNACWLPQLGQTGARGCQRAASGLPAGCQRAASGLPAGCQRAASGLSMKACP
jgi:hypothetical protein